MTCRDVPAWMRTEEETFLVDRCSVKRPTKTQTASGGWAETLSTIATNRPCFVTQTMRQAEERTAGGQIRNIKSRDIHMEWDEDVQDTDLINVTTMNGVAVNKVYQVLDAGDVSEMTIRVVQCKQI